MGANDVLTHWDEARYAASFDSVLTRLTGCAERVVFSNLPSNLRQLPQRAGPVRHTADTRGPGPPLGGRHA